MYDKLLLIYVYNIPINRRFNIEENGLVLKLSYTKLYVVKSSIITYDCTEIDHNSTKRLKIRKDSDIVHIVKTKIKPEDISIAVLKSNCMFENISESVTRDNRIYNGIVNHCSEGDFHVGVTPDDKILLARYLWEKCVSNCKYSKEIEKYLISLKPYYEIEEIISIIKKLKEEVLQEKEETLTLTLRKKKKQSISTKNIYTDLC